MALDPKDLFDPVEGEPLRDILGHLQNANIRQGQVQTNQSLREVASLLQQQQAEARRIAALPSCPYCGGKIDGQFELCRHCKSSLSYVEGLPCKPGQEREFADALKIERERVAKERYESQKLTFRTRDGVDYVSFKCYCGHSLSTKCSNIGSNKQCPKCHMDLLIIGEKEYNSFQEDKNKSYEILIVVGIAFLATLVILFLSSKS